MFKRFFDIVFSLFLLTVLSPVILVVALAVWFVLGRPLLFMQERPGLEARPFKVMKFRTMSNAVCHDGLPLVEAARLGPFGRALRASSMDELPQLLNILRGDMSFVGPRPLLMEYVPLYTHEEARRMDVRPGLTGWAQIHGRNNLDWPSRLAHDIWYVDNANFWLDIKILMRTALTVFRRDGITQHGVATMEPFRGTGNDV